MALAWRKTRIAYWRKIRGYSQEELAAMLGVARRTLVTWEAEIYFPSEHHARAMAKVLQVTVRDLFPCGPF